MCCCGRGVGAGGRVRSGPVSRVLSWAAIYLLLMSPPGSSTLPERGAGHTMALLHALAPEGACQAAWSPRRWWSLTPPFQLFSHPPRRAAGVFFSAALSVGSPRQAVSLPPALWSPDFPHAGIAAGPRSPGPLRVYDCITPLPLWASTASFVDACATWRMPRVRLVASPCRTVISPVWSPHLPRRPRDTPRRLAWQPITSSSPARSSTSWEVPRTSRQSPTASPACASSSSTSSTRATTTWRRSTTCCRSSGPTASIRSS